MKRVSVEIDESLHAWLVDYANSGDTSVSAVVRFALAELQSDCEASAPTDWWESWKKENR